MKHSFFTIIFSLLAVCVTNAQLPKFYGLTSRGGEYNIGAIYSINEDGSGYETEFSFPIENMGESATFVTLVEADNKKLYGTTSLGGTFNRGVIFEYDPSANTYVVVHHFEGIEGFGPECSLTKANNGKLYGTTIYGGNNGNGVIFELDPTAGVYTKLFDFDYYQTGGLPFFSLILGTNGKLFGTTQYGGQYDKGVIFEFDYITTTYKVLYQFDGITGSGPRGDLTEVKPNVFYGITSGGGSLGYGVIYEYDLNTAVYSSKKDFLNTDGRYGNSSLTLASNNKLYGGARYGGSNNLGVQFEYDYINNIYTVVNDAFLVEGRFFEKSPGKLLGLSKKSDIILEYDFNLNTFTTLASFNGGNGRLPQGTLFTTSEGRVFGVTFSGGFFNSGVIFEYVYPNNIIKRIDLNSCLLGDNSYLYNSRLIQAKNGMFYSVSFIGGLYNKGVLFEYNPKTRQYNKLLDFGVSNIPTIYPKSSLVLDTDGYTLYGTSDDFGTTGAGTLFSYNVLTKKYARLCNVDTRGDLLFYNNKIYGFKSTSPEELYEYDLSTKVLTNKIVFNNTYGRNLYGGLKLSSKGKIYGIALEGGTNDKGTFFQYNPSNNTIDVLHNFGDGNSGYIPRGTLEEVNSILYGVTNAGGDYGVGTIFSYDIYNNQYKDETSFDYFYNYDFRSPALFKASSGKLYGVTDNTGLHDKGVLYEFDPSNGYLTKLFDFDESFYNYVGGAPRSLPIEINCFPIEDNSVTQNPTELIANASGYTYQWIDCDTGKNISGEKNQNYIPAQSGNYAVVISDGYCQTTSDCISVQLMSNNTLVNTNFSMVPNPTHGNVAITFNNRGSIKKLKVYDVTGKIIYLSGEFNSNKYLVDISSFENGLYFVEVENDNITTTQKIIKE